MPPDYQQQPAPPPHPANYDFIINPQQPQQNHSSLKLPSGGGPKGLAARIGLLAGGLVILLILFAIIKGVVTKGPDLSGYVSVAQDQQELIHLVGNSNANQQGLSDSDQNFAATISAVMASNQAQVLAYLKNNHQTVKANILSLKVSSSIDTELNNSQTAGTYDSTFQGVVQTQLTSYLKDLSVTYKASSGKNGRALLSSLYKQAELLQTQVSSSSSSD